MIYNLEDKSILFKKISIQLQNDFDATLTVSDKYNLNLAKCIYNYLVNKYDRYTIDPNNYDNPLIYRDREIYIQPQNISDYYLSQVKLYKDITIIPEGIEIPLEDHIYDRNISAPGYEYQTNIQSINDITKYNIAFWPISDNVLQYIIDDTVINPRSSLEDIAGMQKLLFNIPSFSYNNYNTGFWDLDFQKNCYIIQYLSHEANEDIVLTGLCDLSVEKYLRAHNEIRSSSYSY